MRLFFALWPPREAARALHEWASKASRLTGGRPTRAETIHLTLAFLGEIEESRIPALKSIAQASAGKAHVLPVEQARWWKHNHIVWVGPNEIPAQLADLAAELSGALEKEDFKLERRAFAAHVTLIRKAREPNAELPPPPRVDWPVDEFVLVRSALSRAGSSYEVLERFALRGGARPGRK